MPSPRRPPSQETEEIVTFLAQREVRTGARILDAPCGIGRRALELAEHGFRVDAVDPNEVAIQAMRERVPGGLRDRLRYRSAAKDAMPGPPGRTRSEVALCLDHALGREPPQDDDGFLVRLRDHLAPGGFAVFEFLNRDFFAGRPRPFAYHVVGDLEQHEFRTFDPVSGILDLRWTFYQRDGSDLRFRGDSSSRLRLLATHEARRLVEAAGWAVQAVEGGWAHGTVGPDRRKFLLVARPSARD